MGLSEDAVKPGQHQSWIFIRDPDFAAKATRVLDLYGQKATDRLADHHSVTPDEFAILAA